MFKSNGAVNDKGYSIFVTQIPCGGPGGRTPTGVTQLEKVTYLTFFMNFKFNCDFFQKYEITRELPGVALMDI